MNWVYLHILTNHIPIILMGLGTMAAIAALVSRKRIVWIYALTTLTLAGLSVYPVFFAGSRAEDVVMDHDRAARNRIHEHEEAADFALWAVLAAGAISAYGLYRLRKDSGADLPVWTRAAIVVVAVWALSVVVVTALHGGAIRHADWERGFKAQPETAGPAKL